MAVHPDPSASAGPASGGAPGSDVAPCATPTEAGRPAPQTIFYDGHCGLCHGVVKFVAPRDTAHRFDFAPLEGEYIRAVLPADRRAALPDSVVVHTADGSVLTHSAAVVHILRRLGGFWGVVGRVLGVVPGPVRDLGYKAIAAVRHRVWGRTKRACPAMPPALRDRFRF